MGRPALRQHMAKTPSQVARFKQTVTVKAGVRTYCEARERVLGSTTSVYVEALRDHRTFFDLAPDQVALLKAEALKRGLKRRDYIIHVLSERAFHLRKAAGGEKPPTAKRYMKPHKDGDYRTSIQVPQVETEYLDERVPELGGVPDAIEEAVEDHRSFFGLPADQVAFLEQEATALELDNRDYMRRVLSEHAYDLRDRKQAEGKPS